MKETNCDVIRDLLPLYEDNVVSEETAQMVREHLKDCPACREELRKMRTPISLPPDEDEDAVKRFLEHRAEIRKKQNVKIAWVVSVLAVVLVFCLCYTLIPRSWDGVSQGVEPDRIMGSYTVFVFRDDAPGIDVWQMDEKHEYDTAFINEVMDALRAGSYRAELRNALNYTPLGGLFDTSVEGLRGSLYLYLVKDNAVVMNVSLYQLRQGCEVHIEARGDNSRTFFYHTDSGVFDRIASMMEEYGVQG